MNLLRYKNQYDSSLLLNISLMHSQTGYYFNNITIQISTVSDFYFIVDILKRFYFHMLIQFNVFM